MEEFKEQAPLISQVMFPTTGIPVMYHRISYHYQIPFDPEIQKCPYPKADCTRIWQLQWIHIFRMRIPDSIYLPLFTHLSINQIFQHQPHHHMHQFHQFHQPQQPQRKTLINLLKILKFTTSSSIFLPIHNFLMQILTRIHRQTHIPTLHPVIRVKTHLCRHFRPSQLQFYRILTPTQRSYRIPTEITRQF